MNGKNKHTPTAMPAASPPKVRALIPTGLGFNCEQESAEAFRMAGAEATICDIRDIIAGYIDLFDYHILMLVGGFSYGDDLGSGKAMANLLAYRQIMTRDGSMPFVEAIRRFTAAGGVVLGICNGFQILIKLGLLPGLALPDNTDTQRAGPMDAGPSQQIATLTHNDSGRFEDRWVDLACNPRSPSIATKGIDRLYLPVRHGEGKIVASAEALRRIEHGDLVVMRYADERGYPTMRYPENPNGSSRAIAGLCDPMGRIIGLMPHPEAFLSFYHHPHWTRLARELERTGESLPHEGQGVRIFRNIVENCRARLASSSKPLRSIPQQTPEVAHR